MTGINHLYQTEQIVGASMTLRFTRPVSKWEDLTPGGYTFRDKDGIEYQFDFLWIQGTIDVIDPRKVHFELQVADEVSFPQMQEILLHLKDMTAFPECYVGIDPEDLEAEEVEAFTLVSRKPHEKGAAKGVLSPFIRWEKSQLNSSIDEVHYQLMPRILQTCESYPNG